MKKMTLIIAALMSLLLIQPVYAQSSQNYDSDVTVTVSQELIDADREEKGMTQEYKAAPTTGDSLQPVVIWTAIFFPTGLFLIIACFKKRLTICNTGAQRFTQNSAKKRGWRKNDA